MSTPFDWLAERYTVSRRGLRWATTAAMVMSVVLMVTGGVVRVTGSGLGCPEWPMCTDETIYTTSEMGIHGVIEFGNRMLTWALSAAVGWAIIAARLQKSQDRTITRLAWSQFWMVMLNAVIGGITVLTGLNPYIVAGHFLAATALLTTTVLTWNRVRVADYGPPAGVAPISRALGFGVLISTGLVIAVGTLVTGTGPHSGDLDPVHRIPISLAAITWFHGLLVVIVLALAVTLLATLRKTDVTARLRILVFLGVLALQGVIGIVQALTDLPWVLVVLHLFCAALLWIGALRVFLDTPLEKNSELPELSKNPARAV